MTRGMKETQTQCPPEWIQFVTALASSSPVCALNHPSETLFQALLSLESGQHVSSISSLQYLQREVPVLFDLLRRIKSFPSFLPSIIKELVSKAETPFQASCCSIPAAYGTEDVAFFPSPPVVHSRGTYLADKVTRAKICTKHSIGNPTLLPGLFTLFCKHGT